MQGVPNIHEKKIEFSYCPEGTVYCDGKQKAKGGEEGRSAMSVTKKRKKNRIDLWLIQAPPNEGAGWGRERYER